MGRLRLLTAASAMAFMFALGAGSADELWTPPPDSYAPAEDVALGLDAADVIQQRLPMVNDALVNEYLEDLQQQLLAGMSPSLRQPLFRHSVAVLDLPNLVSVALPGGPLFLSRGMIDAAESDGELAGVLAHQLSHIVLRHGTAQATSGEKFQIGAIDGGAIGNVFSGVGGGVFAQASAFVTASYFLTYSHAYERDADGLAARVMASAGYDPRDLTRMFHTIELRGAERGGASRWKASHPDPGDRREYLSRDEFIEREAAGLAIDEESGWLAGLDRVHIRLREIPASAPKTTAAVRGPETGPPSGAANLGIGIPVPSGGSRSETAGDSLLLAVPANWLRVLAGNTVTFAPEGVILDPREPPGAFTHGLQLGVARRRTGDLERDTQALLQSLGRDNPRLSWRPAYQHLNLAGRRGLTTVLSNVSALSGEFEEVTVWAVYLPDGNLLFGVGVAPLPESATYRNAFNRVLESIQIVG